MQSRGLAHGGGAEDLPASLDLLLVRSSRAFGRPALDETALSVVLAGLGPAIHESARCQSWSSQVEGAFRRLVRRNAWMPGPGGLA